MYAKTNFQKNNIMDRNVIALGLSMLAGTAYGVWPGIANTSPVKTPIPVLSFFMGLMLILLSCMQYAYAYSTDKNLLLDEFKTFFDSSKAFKIILLCAFINVGGTAFYYPLLEISKSLNTSVYIAITLSLMLVAAFAAGIIFSSDTLSTKSVIAIILIISGIVLLKIG